MYELMSDLLLQLILFKKPVMASYFIVSFMSVITILFGTDWVTEPHVV